MQGLGFRDPFKAVRGDIYVYNQGSGSRALHAGRE